MGSVNLELSRINERAQSYIQNVLYGKQRDEWMFTLRQYMMTMAAQSEQVTSTYPGIVLDTAPGCTRYVSATDALSLLTRFLNVSGGGSD